LKQSQFTKLHKKGEAKSYWRRDFNPLIFPTILPTLTGVATAGPNDRSIAEEFNQSYNEGILEVSLFLQRIY